MDGELTPWLTDAHDAWMRDAAEWIEQTVRVLGRGEVRAIDLVREQQWGIVLRAATADGNLYFKAAGSGGRHEPCVLRQLAGTWPDLLPEVLASDDARTWLLMTDHGQPLWNALGPAEQVAVYEAVLPVYARLQRESASSLQPWIRCGAPDRRVAVLPVLLERLLAGELEGGALPFAPDLRRGLDDAMTVFDRACAELSAGPIGDALDHGDLHGGNFLVGAGPPCLVDWGDSCVTHPFISLFVTYQLAITKIPKDDRLRAALRLRDAYLETWTDVASASELRTLFTTAIWVAHVGRALDFTHILPGSTPEFIAEWRGYVVELLDQWQQRRGLVDRGDELIDVIVCE